MSNDVSRPEYPLWIANQAEQPNAALEVLDKYSGEVVTRVALADEAMIDRAIGAATAAAPAVAALPAYARQEILDHCVARFRERAEELALGLCVEAGKPIRDARVEVGRLIDTLRIASEEATRIHGEVIPLDVTPRARHYRGMIRRVPLGPVSLVAPAIAAGCPFVLKPSRSRPSGPWR